MKTQMYNLCLTLIVLLGLSLKGLALCSKVTVRLANCTDAFVVVEGEIQGKNFLLSDKDRCITLNMEDCGLNCAKTLQTKIISVIANAMPLLKEPRVFIETYNQCCSHPVYMVVVKPEKGECCSQYSVLFEADNKPNP